MIKQQKFNEVQVKGREPEEIKQTAIKKAAEDKKSIPKQKQLKYYDVKVDTIAPVLITYRVYAETEIEALELIKKKAPISIKPDINKRKILRAKVYDVGGSIIRHTKVYTS